MHRVIKAFIKTHNLNEDLIIGCPRKWNGVDHDDEWWQYGHEFTFAPEYNSAGTLVRVRWWPSLTQFYVKEGEFSKIVSEWVELVDAGLCLDDEKLLKGSTMYPWTVSAGIISRKVFDQEQVIEEVEDSEGFHWRYTCKTCSPICWSLSDSLVSVLLSAEHDAGYFHGRMEL